MVFGTGVGVGVLDNLVAAVVSVPPVAFLVITLNKLTVGAWHVAGAVIVTVSIIPTQHN